MSTNNCYIIILSVVICYHQFSETTNAHKSKWFFLSSLHFLCCVLRVCVYVFGLYPVCSSGVKSLHGYNRSQATSKSSFNFNFTAGNLTRYVSACFPIISRLCLCVLYYYQNLLTSTLRCVCARCSHIAFIFIHCVVSSSAIHSTQTCAFDSNASRRPDRLIGHWTPSPLLSANAKPMFAFLQL